jgi:hypothetical protein
VRSLEMFLEHDAMSYADRIGPVPLLMIVEDQPRCGCPHGQCSHRPTESSRVRTRRGMDRPAEQQMTRAVNLGSLHD